MATWTESDIATLKAAIASGVLTVAYDGPPKRQITYQSLDAMRALLAEMKADVAGTSRVRYRLAGHRKGF